MRLFISDNLIVYLWSLFLYRYVKRCLEILFYLNLNVEFWDFKDNGDVWILI